MRFQAHQLAGPRHRPPDEERCRQCAGGEQQRVEEDRVEDRRRATQAQRRQHQRCAGQQQQRVAENPRQAPLLAQPEPHQARTLQRPGARGAAGVERKRHHQAQEDDGDGQAGVEGQRQRRVALHARGHEHVEGGQHQRRDRSAVGQVSHQSVLEHEGDDGQAEEQAAVDPAVAARRAADGAAAHGHQQHRVEEQEVGEQEALAAGVVRGAVLRHAPHAADDEGEDEADDVEQPPGLEPGHCRDAQVEHQVEGKQRDLIAAAGGHEQRRGKAAQGADDGQWPRVLQHGQRGGEQGHHHHERKHRRQREHAVEAEGDEQRQVQHRHRATLQGLRVGRPDLAQAPAQAEQRQRHGADAGQAHFHRHLGVLGSVLGQEGQADEEDADAGLGDRVAAQQPGAQRRPRAGLGRRGVRWIGCRCVSAAGRRQWPCGCRFGCGCGCGRGCGHRRGLDFRLGLFIGPGARWRHRGAGRRCRLASGHGAPGLQCPQGLLQRGDALALPVHLQRQPGQQRPGGGGEGAVAPRRAQQGAQHHHDQVHRQAPGFTTTGSL